MRHRCKKTGALPRALALLAICPAFVAAAPVLDEVHTLTDGTAVVSVERTISIGTPGSYRLSVADLGLPVPLDALEVGLTRDAVLVATAEAGTAQDLDLDAGSYAVRIVGKPAAGSSGSVSVQLKLAGATTPVVDIVEALTHPSAGMQNVDVLDTTFTLTTAGTYTVSLADFGSPQPLETLTLAITPSGGGVLVASLGAAGSITFSGVPGEYRLFIIAAPVAGAIGSYGVEIGISGATPVFDTVKTLGGTPGATPAFSYPVDVAAAGTYTVRLADFQFPAALRMLRLTAVQGDAILGTLDAPGSLELTLSAGRLYLLAVAQTADSDAGLFGIDLTAAGASPPSFETTQAVGAAFDARRLEIETAGSYEVMVTDVGFPAPFAELSAVVTRGTQRVGSIFGGGTFDFAATPGAYAVNFIATPAAGSGAGTYAITVNAGDPEEPPPEPEPEAPGKGGGGALDAWTLAALLASLAGAAFLPRRRRPPSRPPG